LRPQGLGGVQNLFISENVAGILCTNGSTNKDESK